MIEKTTFELRRRLLQGGASAGLLLPLLAAGLLKPTQLLAAEWKRGAFNAQNVGEALKAMGAGTPVETPNITINAPEIAENGVKVDIEISSSLSNTRSIAVIADKNPMPLCAVLDFSGNVLPFARVQLKLAETTRVRAIVKTADGKSHVAFKEVKVTLGGCGG